MPQVSEDVAREALIKFVGKKWTYSRKPAQNLVFKDLRPFTVYRYRLETFTESRSSAWEHEIYTGQYVDGPQYGSIPPPWQVEVQYPPKFTDTVQKVRVPHTSSVKSCHQCQGKGRVRCIHCHSRGWISCMSCHGAIHGRNRKCVGCHGRGRKVCTWCHGSGHKTCRKCNGRKKLLHFIQLTVTWKNQVYEFIPDRLPEFPIKKFEKVSGEAFFIDESLLVYPIVGFPDKEICNASEEAIHEHLNKYSAVSRILQQRGAVQSYTQRAGVGAGFHSNQAEATPESTESQDQLIEQVASAVAATVSRAGASYSSLLLLQWKTLRLFRIRD
ncbi:protein SSUH2 homolog isoform X5 [Ictalurus punctatus]|nr:protein SSUH2 homolog isoform X5 [Ictalurus punctatus]